MDYESIEKQATLVLKNYQSFVSIQGDCLPIPVKSIAEVYFKFGISEESFDDEVSGKLFLKSRIIYVNSNDSVVRQRFTIAHELGHIQLHTKRIDRDIVISRKTDTGLLEKEANVFAASLLMPRRLVYEKLIYKLMYTTGEDLSWILNLITHIPDSELNAVNSLLSNIILEDKTIEPLLLAISYTTKEFGVSKHALSWRLQNFGLLDKFLT